MLVCFRTRSRKTGPIGITADMQHSNARYTHAVRRIGAEAFWLKTYHAAICGMKVKAEGLDFFRVALNALKEARLLRLIRVLEESKQTASFWYVLNQNPSQVTRAAKAAGLDLQALAHLAPRLKIIRDETFMHIDRIGVLNSQTPYAKAGVTHAEVEGAILGLWQTMRFLYLDVLGEELLGDEYSGDDIHWLADLRDAAGGVLKR
jgi:hypothetical protein